MKKKAWMIGATALAGLLVTAMRSPVLGAAQSSLSSARIDRHEMAPGHDRHPAMQVAGAHEDEPPVKSENERHHRYKSKRHHHYKNKKHRRGAEDANYGGTFFRPVHAGYFRQCYGGGDVENLPPGLQKHVERTGHLPPGLEMQLERNGHLPPGLEKRMSPANPCALERFGQQLPPNSSLYTLGRNAYLINDRTRQIIDVLRGAY